jgi:hypothetical protein
VPGNLLPAAGCLLFSHLGQLGYSLGLFRLDLNRLEINMANFSNPRKAKKTMAKASKAVAAPAS